MHLDYARDYPRTPAPLMTGNSRNYSRRPSVALRGDAVAVVYVLAVIGLTVVAERRTGPLMQPPGAAFAQHHLRHPLTNSDDA